MIEPDIKQIDKSYYILCTMIVCNNLSRFFDKIKSIENIKEYDNILTQMAGRYGRNEILHYLLDNKCLLSNNDYYAVKNAIRNKHYDCLQLMFYKGLSLDFDNYYCLKLDDCEKIIELAFSAVQNENALQYLYDVLMEYYFEHTDEEKIILVTELFNKKLEDISNNNVLTLEKKYLEFISEDKKKVL